jgi:hypothetical protein
MNNKDKMLKLVLSDVKLSTFYEYNTDDYATIAIALKSENTIVVTVAKIIDGIELNSDKANYKEIYNEIINYLNQNIL